MAGSRATRVVPQVVIWTLPPQKPLTPPVDFYALMKQAVKQDTNHMIMAVLQFPPFTQAIVGSAKLPGPSQAPLQIVPGTWHFMDQADFGRIANQKGLVDKLSTTVQLLDCTAANDSPN
ncbi:hypothetical protein C0993_009154, partial [Termitomyces sp. T159_Od127]